MAYQKLPDYSVSDTVGYVTSPNFQYSYLTPNNYDGTFYLNVSNTESALVSLSHIFILSGDYLKFTQISPRKTKTVRGKKNAQLWLSRSSVAVHYHTNSAGRSRGFKMTFAVLPRFLEPNLSSSNMLDCAVPHFNSFEPLISCNMLKECVGGEDEQNCTHHTSDCGPDAIDIGTKCYRLVRPEKGLSWYDAKDYCVQRGEKLVTLASPDERIYFKKLLFSMRSLQSIFVGAHLVERLQAVSMTALYKNIWQWVDGRTAFSLDMSNYAVPTCGFYSLYDYNLKPYLCSKGKDTEFICEFEKRGKVVNDDSLSEIVGTVSIDPGSVVWNVSVVQCPSDHMTRDFLFCDIHAACKASDPVKSCTAGGATVPMFLCKQSQATLPYTLVCDHERHCTDNSDEDFCQHPPCLPPLFSCRNGQCVHDNKRCDGIIHCYDGSDELCEDGGGGVKSQKSSLFPGSVYTDKSGIYHAELANETDHCPPMYFLCPGQFCVPTYLRCNGVKDCPGGEDEQLCDVSLWRWPATGRWNSIFPGVIYLDGVGNYWVEPMPTSKTCPETHFLCQNYYCLPIYLRCNGIEDCPGREDEAGCDSYTCPGFYRCRGSKVCLHADNVCDGVPQCPEQDDELLCDLSCPDQCHCQGLAFVCSTSFSASSYPALRYLDASGSGMTPGDLTDNLYLIHLRLSNCGIISIPFNLTLSNLQELDLSWNKLTQLDMHWFSLLRNLRVLTLTGNPIVKITDSALLRPTTIQLLSIDLSQTRATVFSSRSFRSTPDVRVLNISWSLLETITNEGFRDFLPQLETLDVRGSPLKQYPNDLLRDLAFLNVVYADNYKLCCEAMLPENFDQRYCYAEQDLLASCEDLLKSNTYRIFLWTFAALSIVGNFGSFAARVYLHSEGEAVGSFSVFVTNLSIADLFMGVYLAIIGVADLIYHGEYLWHDDEWKNSTACKIAGFLSLVSCEVSAIIICLITLDRFLVLRFPFSRLHFQRTSALITCGLIWMAGVVLAAVPLLPMTSHWKFYSQTGICIPLPFSGSESSHGYDYTFSVLILLNLVLFLLIAVGQALVYWSIRRNSLASSASKKSKDATIARRLTTVVVSDFLCWFPIALLGVLATTGTPIPGEVNVAVAIFVLPFNSALNPFLYTLNLILEKRNKAQEVQLLKRLENDIAE
ncbi:hypothetical protein V1264_022024 [Littorina saxatilis]